MTEDIQPVTIRSLAEGVYAPMAMKAAMQLDVFSPLKDGPMTGAALASRDLRPNRTLAALAGGRTRTRVAVFCCDSRMNARAQQSSPRPSIHSWTGKEILATNSRPTQGGSSLEPVSSSSCARTARSQS